MFLVKPLKPCKVGHKPNNYFVRISIIKYISGNSILQHQSENNIYTYFYTYVQYCVTYVRFMIAIIIQVKRSYIDFYNVRSPNTTIHIIKGEKLRTERTRSEIERTHIYRNGVRKIYPPRRFPLPTNFLARVIQTRKLQSCPGEDTRRLHGEFLNGRVTLEPQGTSSRGGCN